jgi:hypothetical protein
MDDEGMADEGRLAERLLAVSRYGGPPAGLAERISRDAARQGRRRGALAVAAGTALTIVAVAWTAGSGPWTGAEPPPAGRTTAPAPPAPSGLAAPVPGPAPAPSTLAALFPGRQPLTVPRRLRDGRPFRAFELTPAGTLVGVDQSYDPDGMDRWTGNFLLDPVHGTQTALPGSELPRFSSDGRHLTWLAHTDPEDKFNLLCRDVDGGTPRQLSDGSVREGSVVSGGGRIAWTYYEGGARDDGAVVIADACAGPERVLPVSGYPIGLAGRFLYLLGPAGKLLRHDLESAATQAVPLGSPGAGQPLAVVGPDSVLWSPTDDDGYPGALRARQLSSGREVLVAAAAPRAKAGINGIGTRLTAGHRLLAYSSAPIDGPPGDSRGLVYDPVSNAVVTLPGEVFAAGDWLLWLQDDGYRLLDVS